MNSGYDNYSRVWLSHNILKMELLRRHKLPSNRPCLEFMVCVREVVETDKEYFKIKDVIRVLKQNKLPSHANSAYHTARVLAENRFIEPIGTGRQWFRSRNWALTTKGTFLLIDIQKSCKQQAKAY